MGWACGLHGRALFSVAAVAVAPIAASLDLPVHGQAGRAAAPAPAAWPRPPPRSHRQRVAGSGLAAAALAPAPGPAVQPADPGRSSFASIHAPRAGAAKT